MSLKDVCLELMDGVVGSNSSTAFNDPLAAIRLSMNFANKHREAQVPVEIEIGVLRKNISSCLHT
jgi:hypothetical protein